MRKLNLIIISLILLLAACEPIKKPVKNEDNDATLQTPTADQPANQIEFVKKPLYDTNFVLRMNEDENEVYLPPNIAVKLIQIKDNRCPVDAQCTRAGEVYVVLEVDFVGEDPFEKILVLGGTSPDDKAFAVYYENTFLTLQAVEPRSTAENSVEAEDQTVILSVTRHALQ